MPEKKDLNRSLEIFEAQEGAIVLIDKDRNYLKAQDVVESHKEFFDFSKVLLPKFNEVLDRLKNMSFGDLVTLNPDLKANLEGRVELIVDQVKGKLSSLSFSQDSPEGLALEKEFSTAQTITSKVFCSKNAEFFWSAGSADGLSRSPRYSFDSQEDKKYICTPIKNRLAELIDFDSLGIPEDFDFSNSQELESLIFAHFSDSFFDFKKKDNSYRFSISPKISKIMKAIHGNRKGAVAKPVLTFSPGAKQSWSDLADKGPIATFDAIYSGFLTFSVSVGDNKYSVDPALLKDFILKKELNLPDQINSSDQLQLEKSVIKTLSKDLVSYTKLNKGFRFSPSGKLRHAMKLIHGDDSSEISINLSFLPNAKRSWHELSQIAPVLPAEAFQSGLVNLFILVNGKSYPVDSTSFPH